MNKLGIFSWFGYPLPLEDRFELIADAGFETTSVWLGTDEAFIRSGKRDRMPELARKYGLEVDNAHAPFAGCNAIWSDSAEERSRIKLVYEENLSFCERHDIPVLVFHITSGNTPPPANRSGFETLRELVFSAEQRGVVLAVENTRTPGRLDEVFSRFESNGIGFCYDSSHDFLWGKPPGAILEKWGHLLAATHFSDNAGKIDNHGLPGDGLIDWETVGSCFPRDRYSGPVSLEVVPGRNRDLSPESFLELAFQRAVSLRKTLGNGQAGGNRNN